MSCFFFFSSRRRHTRLQGDWSSDVCSSDLVGDALNHVHWMGILHRDLKPQNIMLGSGGVVKLLDFGVAHEMAQLPAPDACQAGTLAYMSPDQLLGDALGPASDIFSLGVVFYEMLTRSEEHTSEL